MSSFETAPVLNNDVEDNSETKPETIALPKSVYYIESPDDSTVLVGIDVNITSFNHGAKRLYEVSWYDTTHDRKMLASQTDAKGEYFAFKRDETEGGGTYFFTPMNLKVYDAKVRDQLSNAPAFDNPDDMIKAFLKTKENSY